LIKEANEEGKKNIVKAFSQSRDVEDRHAELYKKALSDMLADRQTDYYVCQICGYISEDEVPDNCLVWDALKGKFKPVK